MQCATEEKIPSIGIHIHKDDKGAIPPELRGRVVEWRWDYIANFIKRVDSKRSLFGRFVELVVLLQG